MSKEMFLRRLKADYQAGRISKRAAQLLWEKAQ